jgi:hypothetical protein
LSFDDGTLALPSLKNAIRLHVTSPFDSKVNVRPMVIQSQGPFTVGCEMWGFHFFCLIPPSSTQAGGWRKPEGSRYSILLANGCKSIRQAQMPAGHARRREFRLSNVPLRLRCADISATARAMLCVRPATLTVSPQAR